MVEKLEELITMVFSKLGYNLRARVIKSNRPDISDYQCDDAFKLAKEYHKNPIELGELVVSELNSLENFNEYFSKVEFIKPGFINMTLSDEFINNNIRLISNDDKFGIKNSPVENYVMDYGGPNVAKPLHVGHMRTAIVGESIKRIIRYKGNNVICDTHLGDYGLQLGQVIYGIKQEGKTIDDIDINFLDYIYPKMSGLCKENEEVKSKCAQITKELQDGNPEYRELWKKIMQVSVSDIKGIYDYLDVNFDYWYGESDAYKYLDETTNILESKNLLEDSEGAKIVKVSKEDDKKELPPFIYKSSIGSYLYSSTDLATIVQRVKDFNPNHILYVVDNRQALHFEQLFRVCDKTRSGEAPKLQNLFNEAKEILLSKKEMSSDVTSEDIDKIVNSILKFADLQNSREKDYIFDISKFSEVIGKTGPYILYTYLRINKIINGLTIDKLSNNIYNEFDRNLRLKILDLPNAFDNAFENRMPHFIAEYVYELCVLANAFYQNNHINGEEDLVKKNDWINILNITCSIIKEMLSLLVIEIPDSM